MSVSSPSSDDLFFEQVSSVQFLRSFPRFGHSRDITMMASSSEEMLDYFRGVSLFGNARENTSHEHRKHFQSLTDTETIRLDFCHSKMIGQHPVKKWNSFSFSKQHFCSTSCRKFVPMYFFS